MADIKTITLPNGNVLNLKDANAARVWYGLCSTAASTSPKTVSITGVTSDTLVNGSKIVVRFSNAQSYNGLPSLNVSSTGNKSVYYTDGTQAGKDAWGANAIVTFTYYSGAWYMDRRDYLTLSTLPIYDGTVV